MYSLITNNVTCLTKPYGNCMFDATHTIFQGMVPKCYYALYVLISYQTNTEHGSVKIPFN